MMCTERNGMPCPRTGTLFPASFRSASGKRTADSAAKKPCGSALNPAAAADRAILYTALSLFIGTIFFHLFWYKGKTEQLAKRTRRILIVSITALGLALLLQLPIQTKANAGGGWGSAFQPGYIRETLFETAAWHHLDHTSRAVRATCTVCDPCGTQKPLCVLRLLDSTADFLFRSPACQSVYRACCCR